jgi:L-alanine-DL-glutamate epimerase-like enolase superfamily enzyme
MHIEKAELEIQREPFVRPFAFKGALFREKWNLVVRLEDECGQRAYGVGGLAVLWSDPRVFARHSEVGGNALMVAMLERSLSLVRGRSFASPQALFYEVLPAVYEYGRTVTGQNDLRHTFALNALVALDNAAWMLWAKGTKIDEFSQLVPEKYRALFAHKQERIAAVPAVGYNMSDREVEALVEAGAYVLKIKIGHAGMPEEMLARDIEWLERLHALVRDRRTPMTDSGHVLYYLDANGRYSDSDSLRRLVDHLEKIGAREHVVLLEEPFTEELEGYWGDIGVPLAADESVHSVIDVVKRVEQGYAAMAVKAAGKTLSLALDLVETAHAGGLCCFVADNACVPLLVEWNKNVAARLPAFPGIKGGLMETNGAENYGPAWGRMLDEHPCAGAEWLQPQGGAFYLHADFYAQSGGLFAHPEPYARLFAS